MSAVASNNNCGQWDHISQSYSQLRLPHISEEVVAEYSRHCQPSVVMLYAVVLARCMYSEVSVKCAKNVIFLAVTVTEKTEVGKASCVVVVTWFEPALAIVFALPAVECTAYSP